LDENRFVDGRLGEGVIVLSKVENNEKFIPIEKEFSSSRAFELALA